jgi:hypothetical protein
MAGIEQETQFEEKEEEEDILESQPIAQELREAPILWEEEDIL